MDTMLYQALFGGEGIDYYNVKTYSIGAASPVNSRYIKQWNVK